MSNIIKDTRVPKAFQEPDWVPETFDKFENIIREDFKKRKYLDHTLVKKSIQEILLDNRVKPSYPLHSKNVNKLVSKMYDVFDNEEFQYRYYFIYRAGFFLSTFSSDSFTPNALELPQEFKPKKAKIIKEYEARLETAKNQAEEEKAILWVDKAFQKLAKEVLQYFRERDYPLSNFLDSGAKGKEDDLRKLLVAVGLSINTKGEINDVIERSGSEGLSPTQFFNYSSQAISSLYAKSHETAKPGYLIRQLHSISAPVKLSKQHDCGTTKFLNIKIINKDMLEAFHGKMRKTQMGLEEITKDDTDLIGTKVQIRSPLYCKAEDGICVTCYNPWFVDRMQLREMAGIGTLASSAQAELLVNLTLKASHTGLSLGREEIDFTEDAFIYSN